MRLRLLPTVFLASVAALTTALPKPAQAQIYTPQWKIGGAAQKTETPGKFAGEIHGMTLDSKGNIYVAGYYSVQKFDKNGKFLLKFGERGTGNGQFQWGCGGIAVGKNGTIYVSDWSNHRIQKFGPDGAFLSTFGVKGTGGGQFTQPNALAIDRFGNLFVADGSGYYDYRIQKFNASGHFVARYDRYNNRATSLATDNAGNLFTVGIPFRGLPNVQKITPNGTASAMRAVSKSIGYEANDARLTVDDEGKLYTVDSGCRVCIWSSKGILLSKFGAPAGNSIPAGISVDENSDVYLASYGNESARVTKFRRRYLAP